MSIGTMLLLLNRVREFLRYKLDPVLGSFVVIDVYPGHYSVRGIPISGGYTLGFAPNCGFALFLRTEFK